MAASFASAIDTSESLLDLMFIKNEAHIVTAGRGLERAEKLLEVLAGVTPERSGDFKSLAQLVLRHRDDLTSCLVILNGWDETRAELLRTLTEAASSARPSSSARAARPPACPATGWNPATSPAISNACPAASPPRSETSTSTPPSTGSIHRPDFC